MENNSKFTFSLLFWQYPVLMSIFQFLQTFSGIYFKPKSLILIPVLSASSHLFAFFQEDAELYNELKMEEEKIEIIISQTTLLCSSNYKVFSFHRIKKIKEEEEEEEGNKYYPKMYCLLLILGFVNIFPHSIYMLYAVIREVGSLQSFINIMFTSLFCYLILKTKLYRHHYLSIIVFFFNIAVYFWIKYAIIDKQIKNIYSNWWYFILLTLAYIIPTSFREVLEKYIMDQYFLSAYRILLFEGIFLLIVFMIYLVIIQFVQCSTLGWMEILCYKSKWVIIKIDIIDNFSCSSIYTLFSWTYIIGVYLASYYRVETIRKLTPTHRFVCEMLSQLYWLLYRVIENTETDYWYMYCLDAVQVIILLLASFVFNEFIIINLYNLEFYTNMEIIKRGTKDMSMSTASMDLFIHKQCSNSNLSNLENNN